MTFGSVFGRTFSPTFQPSSQAAASASEGWWNLDGTIASCVAAYQPKGAASYASSKVNLANPGTYDATEGTAPDWDAVNGWKFDGIDDILITGIIPPSTQEFSLIIRISNGGGPEDACAMGVFESYTSTMLGINPFYLDRCYFRNKNQYAYHIAGGVTDGVLCVAGVDCYVDGSNVGTIPTGTPGTYTKQIKIGADQSTGKWWLGYMQAAAVYNAAITSTQVSALTTAINAL